jgi:hypothetical protein
VKLYNKYKCIIPIDLTQVPFYPWENKKLTYVD